MESSIKNSLEKSIAVKKLVAETLAGSIAEAARSVIESLRGGGKVLFMGNGGSAADAQHLAAELVSRFLKERKALAAIALTTDTSILTAVGNDYGYDRVFERQVEALVRRGDVVVGISTSGNSENVWRGMRKAGELGAKTIGLLGCGGGKIKEKSHIAITVPSDETPRIQEAHITIGHILCDEVEKACLNF